MKAVKADNTSRKDKQKIFQICYRSFAIVCCIVALVLNSGIKYGKFMPHMFTYYTYLSNILVLVYFILALTPLKMPEWVRGAVTTAILLTMLTYSFLLAPTMFAMGGKYAPFSFGDIMVHYVVPLLMIYEGVFVAKPGSYKIWYPWTWTAIPIVYFIFVLIRGAVGGVIYGTDSSYPYFFVDPAMVGVGGVIGINLAIALFFVGLGFLFVLFNRLLKKRADRKAAEVRLQGKFPESEDA